MKVASVWTLAALAGATAASRSMSYVSKMLPPRAMEMHMNSPPIQHTGKRAVDAQAAQPVIAQNKNTTKFAVNGKKIPDVDFDIGESYAGLLPISGNKNESRELFFWYFPSADPKGRDEITIWLNGGPGCSSLEGFLQENGPFLWQYGTFKPVQNPWSWTKLTSMIWVEQPVGTGFSQGTPTATSEEEVAAQFLGFFKNFIDTFSLHGKKIYIAGESYAGYYVPYIADAMHNAKSKDYYDLQSIMIYDPSTTYDVVQQQIPAVPFVDHWAGLFNLNETFTKDIHKRSKSCGYDDFFEKHLVKGYPPKGPLPTPPDYHKPGCDLWTDIYVATSWVNPCFDIYQVATTCPLLWDVLGFPGSFDYLPEGASIYFNRTDVQKAINAPVGNWQECSGGVLDKDTSPQSGLSILPRVIERNKRTVIAHANLDYILIANGTLLMIQNMTWSGKQGFQKAPKDDFFVPYQGPNPLDYGSAPTQVKSTLAASGIMGKTHTERGLTWVETYLAGHMVPQYAPSAAFRQLEFMLGRIDKLTK